LNWRNCKKRSSVLVYPASVRTTERSFSASAESAICGGSRANYPCAHRGPPDGNRCSLSRRLLRLLRLRCHLHQRPSLQKVSYIFIQPPDGRLIVRDLLLRLVKIVIFACSTHVYRYPTTVSSGLGSQISMISFAAANAGSPRTIKAINNKMNFLTFFLGYMILAGLFQSSNAHASILY
jgi:hypothetical protein